MKIVQMKHRLKFPENIEFLRKTFFKLREKFSVFNEYPIVGSVANPELKRLDCTRQKTNKNTIWKTKQSAG